MELALIQFANDISSEAHVELRISKFVETSCDLLQEIFRKENTSTYRRLCLTLAYLKPRNHRHQQLWLRTSLSSSIPPKFHYLSLLSPTHCVSILPVVSRRSLVEKAKQKELHTSLFPFNRSCGRHQHQDHPLSRFSLTWMQI